LRIRRSLANDTQDMFIQDVQQSGQNLADGVTNAIQDARSAGQRAMGVPQRGFENECNNNRFFHQLERCPYATCVRSARLYGPYWRRRSARRCSSGGLLARRCDQPQAALDDDIGAVNERHHCQHPHRLGQLPEKTKGEQYAVKRQVADSKPPLCVSNQTDAMDTL
jgi:hypothetical protein